MAKELPYFKFEPNQWENGNIQICSREDKGLFLDLCSMYWSRLGDVPFKLAVQKLCGGNAGAFELLLSESIFEVADNMICIDFLNEQLEEFENTSKTNSQNAKEGWKKRRKQKDLPFEQSEKDATALKSQSETDGIREEKRREEKKEQQQDATAPADMFPGVPPEVARDFVKLRAAKKAPVTKTALAGIEREAGKAGMTLTQALQTCCERGWTGFKAEWVMGTDANEPTRRLKELA